jgi:hypothetical protein
VQIAVAVAGVKRLYRHCDQEVAFSRMTNGLAAGSMAHPIGLMQRMRDMVSKGALVENPLAVSRRQAAQKHNDESNLCSLHSHRHWLKLD